MNRRQIATVLAALRLHQTPGIPRGMTPSQIDQLRKLATNNGELEPLTSREIDELMSELQRKLTEPTELPTDFRVRWEIDTFGAETPRQAAEEAFENVRALDTHATCFTVYGRDGSVTEVDLADPEGE